MADEKLALAAEEYEDPFTNHEHDHDFWRGVEMLMRETREDLERLSNAADQKGGA